ncbi:MAG: protein kinase domain-containing protein, partial [Planctomycetota bacterium]
MDTSEGRTRTWSEPASRIGRYTIIERIGAGGMGEVFLAEDPDLRRRVAIKLLPPHLRDDASFATRFKREAQAAAALSHPGIVTVYEVGEHEGFPFIAMEYVQGQTLRELLKDGRLGLDRAVSLAAQVAEGLAKAHAGGIVHRDIKPANIIVDDDGRARILDFGLAALPGSEKVTKTGSTMGTLGYMAPEQVAGGTADERADLFSLGAVLYELLTGHAPFDRANHAATLKAICEDDPEPVRRHCPDVPASVERVVERLLIKDPARRYGCAGDVARDLHAIGQDRGQGGRPSRHQRRAPVLLAGVVIVAGAVTLGLWRPWGSGTTIGAGGATEDAVPTTPIRRGGRLVILPLQKLGGPEGAMFPAALTEELTSRLSEIRELAVIDRTSAIRYEGKSPTTGELDEQLHVDYYLTGSVYWESAEGKSIRISARLVRVSDDEVIWTNTDTRELDAPFTLLGEISQQVVAGIAGELGVVAIGSGVAQLGTTSDEAYGYYQAAKRFADMPDPHVRANKDEAVRLFERAVETDERFAQAWAELAWAHAEIYLWGHDRSDERLEMALRAIGKAREVDADLPEAHLAMAYYRRCRLELDEALAELDAAEQRRPHSVRIRVLRAGILGRQGKYEEAAALMDDAEKMSPHDAYLPHETGDIFMPARRFDEAEAFYRKSIELAPKQVLAYACQAENHWLQGELVEAREVIEDIPEGSDPRTIVFHCRRLIFEGDFKGVIEFLEGRDDVFIGAWRYQPVDLYRAWAYEMLGDTEKARQSFGAA